MQCLECVTRRVIAVDWTHCEQVEGATVEEPAPATLRAGAHDGDELWRENVEAG